MYPRTAVALATTSRLRMRRLYWLGFKGEFSELKDEPIEFVYEAQANPADHAKVRGTESGMSRPGV